MGDHGAAVRLDMYDAFMRERLERRADDACGWRHRRRRPRPRQPRAGRETMIEDRATAARDRRAPRARSGAAGAAPAASPPACSCRRRLVSACHPSISSPGFSHASGAPRRKPRGRNDVDRSIVYDRGMCDRPQCPQIVHAELRAAWQRDPAHAAASASLGNGLRQPAPRKRLGTRLAILARPTRVDDGTTRRSGTRHPSPSAMARRRRSTAST